MIYDCNLLEKVSARRKIMAFVDEPFYEWFVEGGRGLVDPDVEIRSIGEKPLIFGVKRKDGKVFETPLRGSSALEFKSALKWADEEIGPVVVLDTGGHTSYPQATEWIGILHRAVNRSEDGFVNELGIHLNGVKNLWSHERGWIERARGYGSMRTLKRAVKAHHL